ncbi:hypothetical protein [Fulvivirga kasyanovii]|uniref:Uncharacterized protein n=1 Tax=Fulvivirga kasyanovii TaxID=396812 RepID=A0ABW9RST1_9BACT|nr:hypothetical protein [Fulvivirga kasyanovii]MTI27232.1 hypothetical protein [Fulvivirga kasyanovii]
MINTQMILGFAIHCILALITSIEPEYPFIPYFFGIVVVFNIIGLMLIKTGKTRPGAMVFLISSGLLVPIGLIGAMGARKVLDKLKKDEFLQNDA